MNRKTNEDISHRVADEFCKAYTRRFGVPASVIVVEKENVDAIIRVGEVMVPLELVSYRQKDEYHEVEQADSQVREKISGALAIANLPPFMIHISWAIEPRTKMVAGLSNQRARVPPGRKTICFAEQIAELVDCAQKDYRLCNNYISFCNDPEDRNQNPTPGWIFLDRKRFPLLSQYCASMTLAPSAAGHSLQTSVNFRVVGLDENHLKSIVRDKLEKLALYRDSIGGKQLWLAVHSDGRFLSTRLPPGLHEHALDVIRQEIQKAERSFDKVWWVENSGFLDAAELFEAQ